MERLLDERHYSRYEELVRDGTVVVEEGPGGVRRLVWADVWEEEEEEEGKKGEGSDGDEGGGGKGSEQSGGGPGRDPNNPGLESGPRGDEATSNKPAPRPRLHRKPVDPTYGTDMLSLLGKNNGIEKDPVSGKTTFEKYLDGEINVSQQSIFGKDIPREYSDDEAVRARYGLGSAPVKRGGGVEGGLRKEKVNCDVVPEAPEWRDEEYIRLAECLGLRDQVKGPYRAKMPGFE